MDRKSRQTLGLSGGLALITLLAAASASAQTAPQTVEVPAGKFVMGAAPEASRDWFNERPAHPVTISKPFRIAATEVTLEDWRRFKPDAPVSTDQGPYVAGISWDDATAYAAWLSARTGRHYRLPTEAEWEYVARLAAREPARYGAIQGLHSGPKEWTADRFGAYPATAQTDPTGAASGNLRVVRGGRIGFNPSRAKTDREVEIEYSKPEARLAFPPAMAPYAGAEAGGGFHSIGLRLVEGPAPAARPAPVTPPMHAVGIRQDLSTAKLGPDPSKPYFRRRFHLPTPPDDSEGATIDQAGWDPSFREHHHSPAITVAPNGDVLIVEYSTYREYEAGGTMIATRLRHGADEWDPPAPFVDLVGVNDHASLLMADGGKTWFFWGAPYMEGQESGTKGFPFQFMTSDDSGATWSDITFPKVTKAGPHNRQPINTAFRDRNGRILLSSDAGSQEVITEASNNQSLLWASDDDGKSWYDTGARTFGRHTSFVEAKDGRILGFGGKNTDIDGFMPLSTSTDGGKSYATSKLPFAALGSGQRPQALRLQSGRLLVLGDHVRAKPIVKPTAQRGSYAAISDDDGKTWSIKALPGANPHQNPERARNMEGSTVGYVGAAQGPDGVIHVVTSATHPAVTLSFNEAWLDAPEGALPAPETLERNDVTAVTGVKTYEERFPDGTLRGRWTGGLANTGALVFDGPQTWRHANGKTAWEVRYALGRKTGLETLYDVEGKRLWTRDHKADGLTVWTRWWPNGQVRSVSRWRGQLAEGGAQTWDSAGKLLSDVVFAHGTTPHAKAAHP